MKVAAAFLTAVLCVSSGEGRVWAQSAAVSSDNPQPTPKTFRLTYTITEIDNDKRIGTQHFSVVVLSGQKTDLKQGSKVPVVTGTFEAGTHTQNDFQYLDVGLEILASLDSKGERLNTKLVQSSVIEEKPSGAVQDPDPAIRQTMLECASMVTLGKPLILGSLDIPESTRRLDVEVVMEAIR